MIIFCKFEIFIFIKQLQLSFICKEYDFQINSIKNQDYKISVKSCLNVLLQEKERCFILLSQLASK